MLGSNFQVELPEETLSILLSGNMNFACSKILIDINVALNYKSLELHISGRIIYFI